MGFFLVETSFFLVGLFPYAGVSLIQVALYTDQVTIKPFFWVQSNILLPDCHHFLDRNTNVILREKVDFYLSSIS